MYNVSSNTYHVFAESVACVIHFCMLILTQHEHAFRVVITTISSKKCKASTKNVSRSLFFAIYYSY